MSIDSQLPLLDREAFQQAYDKLETPLSIAVLDIDYFKAINDRYGHAIGDEVLKILERNLCGSLPHDAHVARIGGDEYAVLLADTPAENALIVMEEIRQHFSRRPPHESISHTVSISVGIAHQPSHAKDFSALMAAADEALLRAKREGRSRTAIYVEAKMTLKSNYYSKAGLEKLSKLSNALDRTEASLLREAMDNLFIKYAREL